MEHENIEEDAKMHSKKMQREMTAPMAIVIAGALIAGSILIGLSWFKTGSGENGQILDKAENATAPDKEAVVDKVSPVSKDDRTLGNATAPVTVIEYADFQCPFCGRFFKDVAQPVKTNYVNTGKVRFVYRDFTFLGEESTKAAEAARCAGDQGKFWDYHDYLFTHQQGENQGHFSNPNLKSFAKELGLNTSAFNSCLDSDKYAKAVADSTAEGSKAGVQGTPKGFIMVNGKTVSTIDGAEPLSMVTDKLDKVLK